MASPFQVVKFVKVDMGDSWTLSSISAGFAKYVAAKEGKLIVVAEGDCGLWSYIYSIKPDTVVYILNDVIHIPVRYTEKQNANYF